MRIIIISKFFRKAYSDEVTNLFVYAKGNGNIKNIVSDLLKNSTDNIVVYMDMIPGNKEMAKIYKSLRDMSFKSQYRLIVLPVVCMEYYLIKSLKDSQVMKSQTGIDICINKDVYFDSPLITTDADKIFVKNFEKYCKLILIKNLKKCASHSGKTTEISYGTYYLKDCFCQYEEIKCIEEKLPVKVTRYISQFDYIPADNNSSIEKIQNTEELWNVHRKLVQEYNGIVERYINSENVNVDISQYVKIKVIR